MPILNTPITNKTPLANLITYAQAEIGNLLVDEEFIVQDLFLGYEWKRIDIVNRGSLGSSFYNFATNGPGAAQIKPLANKTPLGQQIYRKL